MNQKVFYSMMAASLIPGAALQAAVNVQTSDIALSSQQDGSLAKVTVEFGTLVPGSYTLTGMVDPYKSGMKATLAGVEWDLTSTVINKTITITQVTENVTLEISGPDAFTLGAYLLKIDWNLDKTAWNALITSVKTKVGTTFNGKLTDAHKTAFTNQITAKEEDIEALADAYETYAENELWKLSEGEDKISQDIKAIETAAEAQVIEDCWATKTAAYDAAVAATVVPSADALSDLSTDIGNLQINKSKRQTSYNTLSGQVNTYLAGATTAKGTKPTTWQAAIEDVFVYNPTPNAATIMGSYNTLKGYVDTDAANYTRKQAMDARVTAAQTAIGNVNTNNTQNVTARTANATEKSNITSGLNTYKSEALSAYNTAIASDGAAFAYDPTANEVEYPALKALEDRITELSAKIVTDNQNYEATYAAIQDSYAAATTHYNQKMAELTAYITEEEYAAFLEGEQAKLIAKKEELDNLSAGYASTYGNGGDLDEDAANDAINGKKTDMDGIVTNAKTTVDKFRTNFAGFQDDIDGLSANLVTKKNQAQDGGVYSVVQAEIEAVEGQISQLQANLEAANNSPYAIGEDSYAPETTSGESIDDVQDAIDDIDVATAIAEFNAYNNATQAINDAKDLLDDANETMNSHRANERTGYPTTPSALWTAQYNSILESLEKTGDDNDLKDVVNAKYAAGQMAAYYGDGVTSEFGTAIGTIRTNITNYLNDAKAAIDSYCTFYGAINTAGTGIKAKLNAFKGLGDEVTDKCYLVYNDASVLFTAQANYLTKVAAIEGQIAAAESALATAIGKTGSEHKAAMAALNIESYTVNASLKTINDTEVGANGDKKLADAIDALSSKIEAAQVEYNHTDFDNYKASKTPVIDPSAPDDAVRAVKQSVIDALAGITYDDNKTLDENKAAVDNNQTVKSYSDELAAAEIVQFVRNLVSSNVETLTGLVNASKTDNTGKMGQQEAAFQQEYTDLLTSLAAIMENDQNPENFKTIDDFELKADPTEEEQQAEGFDPSKYLYNTNVKKVAGFNALLNRIGRATDEVSASTIYGNYNDLKTRADARVVAVQANQDAYDELSKQFSTTYTEGVQYKLEQAKTTIGTYSAWTQGEVDDDVTEIQDMIDDASDALDEAYDEEALTATSTIENQSTILAAIETLKTKAQNKQTQYLTSEAKYPYLEAELSDKSADEQKVQDGDNWKYNYDGYGYTLNQAWEYIEANYNNDDVKASAGTEKDRISGLITDARQALGTARANATLTATTTIQTLMGENYVDIPAAINKMKSDAQKKFQKVEAHNAVVAKYNDVNAALVQERTAAVNAAADDANTQPGAGAVAYYRGLFNNAGGYAALLTAIQTAYEAAYDDPDLVPAEYQREYTDQLDDLKAEFVGTADLAEANKNSYKAQMVKYNEAKDAYDDAFNTLDAFEEDDFVAEAITLLNTYSYEGGYLATALQNLENSYTTGSSVTDNTVNTNEIARYVNKIQEIKEEVCGPEGTEGTGTYYAQVMAANDATYNGEVTTEIGKIRPAYNDAVRALQRYTSAQDAALNDKIQRYATDLNNAVFNTIQDILDFDTKAQDQRDTNTHNKKVWDPTALIEEIQNYVASLNTTKENFLSACKNDIVKYWLTVKTAREQTITDAYDTLDDNGYISTEEPENIFASRYAEIALGDSYIYEQKLKEGTEDEYETVVREGIISINDLDNLVFDGALEEETFADAVEDQATEFAQKFVRTTLAAYGQAKQEADLAGITAVFGDNPVDYGKPTPETPGVVDQFNTIVEETIGSINPDDVTYEDDYEDIDNLLVEYANRVAALKATAQQWVADQTARDLQLHNAQATLRTNQQALGNAVAQRQSELDALKTQIDRTSMAGVYRSDLNDIQALITTAKDVSEAEVPTTLDEVTIATINVATQLQTMIGSSAGTPIFLMQSVEGEAVSALKYDLRLLIPDLQVQFNAYAGSEEADQGIVTDWNNRIQTAIKRTKDNYESTTLGETTLKQLADLQLDLAQLRTEMGNMSGEMTTTINKFKSDIQEVLDYELPNEDYGLSDFEGQLATIKGEAQEILVDVISHDEDHGKDILPYVDIISGQIYGVRENWEKLKTNAAAKASKVQDNIETIEDWNESLTAILTATLGYDITYFNYGDEYSTLKNRLEEIKTLAQTSANMLNEESDYYDILKDKDDLVGTTGFSDAISNYQTELATLQNEATDVYNDWSDKKDLSDEIYTYLSGSMGEVESAINQALDDIDSYHYAPKTSESNLVNTYSDDFAGLKEEIDGKSVEFKLWNVNPEDYTDQFDALKTKLKFAMNAAAKKEAKFLYQTNQGDPEAETLVKAKEEARDAYNSWTFSATLKAAVGKDLKAIDDNVTKFWKAIDDATDSYDKLSVYADTAQVNINKYIAIKVDIKDYIENFVFGDANEDQKVNVLDYRAVTNMILDPSLQSVLDPKRFQAIDVNADEVIEVGDLTAIVNYILEKDWQGYAGVKGWMDENASESLTMTTSMTQQGTQRIAVNLASVENYTAFQLDVVLPEGMTIVGQTLSDRAGNSHKLYSRAQQDGSIRFLASSIKGETFSGNEGAVLYIDVETGANFNGGNVELLNILFSDTEAQTRAFAVDANGEATGISFMNAIESLKQKVYDLSGRMMNGMKKGVNIIQGADGTTKKVLK